MDKFFAFITARGGSKGLPRKNCLPLAGKPLIAHTIEAARGCSAVSRTFVTTEDDEIKAISRTFGAEIIDRPAALAADRSTSESVIEHALEALESSAAVPEHFILLQPTSPLRTSGHLAQCISQHVKSGADATISVCEWEHHPYLAFTPPADAPGTLLPLFAGIGFTGPRQLLPKAYRPNGAIYILRTKAFLLHKTFLPPSFNFFLMDARSSIDIDSSFELELCESLLSGKK